MFFAGRINVLINFVLVTKKIKNVFDIIIYCNNSIIQVRDGGCDSVNFEICCQKVSNKKKKMASVVAVWSDINSEAAYSGGPCLIYFFYLTVRDA